MFAVDNLHRHLISYFLSDNVYTNFVYLMSSYKISYTKDLEVRRFNKRLSRVRIDIKHAFEMLKEK
jgi:hypothetical protein